MTETHENHFTDDSCSSYCRTLELQLQLQQRSSTVLARFIYIVIIRRQASNREECFQYLQLKLKLKFGLLESNNVFAVLVRQNKN